MEWRQRRAGPGLGMGGRVNPRGESLPPPGRRLVLVAVPRGIWVCLGALIPTSGSTRDMPGADQPGDEAPNAELADPGTAGCCALGVGVDGAGTLGLGAQRELPSGRSARASPVVNRASWASWVRWSMQPLHQGHGIAPAARHNEGTLAARRTPGTPSRWTPCHRTILAPLATPPLHGSRLSGHLIKAHKPFRRGARRFRA